NFGHVNDFRTVLDAALALKHREDIVFLFIGEGGKESELREFAASNALLNIRFMCYQAREITRLSLTAGDAILVTLSKGLAGLSVPSKTYPGMAAGRPLLFVGDLDSTAARIADAGCGATVASGDVDGFVRIVSEWTADKSKAEALGRRARSVFETRFDRTCAVDSYVSVFEKCMASHRQKGSLDSQSSTEFTKPEQAG
ncbi:MAG TPA: hypothetical protein VEZ90_19815, partial [Blastocatellia bacterium]|nr:hypothetical protein [Blastocatellia bacterium]